jgi:hypothetical protein
MIIANSFSIWIGVYYKETKHDQIGKQENTGTEYEAFGLV